MKYLFPIAALSAIFLFVSTFIESHKRFLVMRPMYGLPECFGWLRRFALL